MILQPFPILEDSRVLLRPVTINDMYHLESFATEESEIWKFSLVSAAGVEGMKAYITAAIKESNNGSSIPFVVFDKKSQTYAGSTRFYNINEVQKTLMIGYTWYGAAFRGTGLNKHCKYLMLQYAFEQLGCMRVEFRADNNNIISKAAMESIGAVKEGILRSDSISSTGIRRNSIVYSILKSEWDNTIKEKLQNFTLA